MTNDIETSLALSHLRPQISQEILEQTLRLSVPERGAIDFNMANDIGFNANSRRRKRDLAGADRRSPCSPTDRCVFELVSCTIAPRRVYHCTRRGDNAIPSPLSIVIS
ncbi:hypothetical protein AC1031_004313 [Aphanomyces cochlioides]|nr:hypothetical protein AC1031_004313 [Aphanomyces cochlioides]